MPGTYSVIVTPRSFADLPEYAASSGSPTSARNQPKARQDSRALPSPSSSRRSTQSDPNVVVLDRFEDLPTTTSPSSCVFPLSGQGGLPDSMQHMSLNIPPALPAPSRSTTPTMRTAAESRLVLHFRSYIIDRLVPSSIKDSQNGSSRPGPIGDIFETAAKKFPPVSSILNIIDRFWLIDTAPSRDLRAECTQPQLPRPSHSRRSDRTLRPGTLRTISYTLQQRHVVRRSLSPPLPPLHL
jgi:hypothetical protein